MDNYLYSPKLNPLIFYREDRAVTNTYQTPNIDLFPHGERGKAWLQGDEYCQVWQTTDIIYLQFSSTFDPIVIELLNESNQVIDSFVGLNVIPNRDFPGLYVYEFAISLSGLTTGCYRFRRKLGSGDGQVIEYTACQHISADPIPDTLLIKYKHSSFFKDVMFETGIEFWFRVHGWIDSDKTKKERKAEGYRNQKFTSVKTSAKSTDSVPIHFGNELGLPVEHTLLIEDISELDTVTYDDVAYTLPADKEFEYNEEEGYRLRCMKGMFEPGLTRNSRITKVNSDTTKKLMYGIVVDQAAISDTTGQGNNNLVPIFNVVIQ